MAWSGVRRITPCGKRVLPGSRISDILNSVMNGWRTLIDLLGGLALFLFGMRIMSEHLQQAAGDALRRGLTRTAGNRVSGYSLGMLLGLSIQSGPASVMLVGLAHAGLLSLAQAAPVVFGFNLGTTLAMQVLAFRVYAFWPVPVAIGLLLTLVRASAKARDAGMSLIGFGLLILGLGLMTGSLEALREPLTPWLAGLHGATAATMLLGILGGLVVTGLLFSSAASIGMCLALAASGTFTDIRQVYPIVLGAQLGTCVTSLLAACNANNTGRRTALVHVGFNVVNGLLGVLLVPFLPAWIERLTPDDLPRQIANLHTVLRASTGLLLLPFSGFVVNGVRRYSRRGGEEVDASRLKEQDTGRPEQALLNAVAECGRLAGLCLRGLRINAGLMRAWDPGGARRIAAAEAVIDRVKPAFQDYLRRVSGRKLSHRQAVLIPALNRCIIAIERIQDHNEHLCELLKTAHGNAVPPPDPESLARLKRLHECAVRVVEAMKDSCETDPRNQDFSRMALEILRLGSVFQSENKTFRSYLTEQAWRKGEGLLPVQGLFLDACANDLEEIVQHARKIANVESHEAFFIKAKKLSREASRIDP